MGEEGFISNKREPPGELKYSQKEHTTELPSELKRHDQAKFIKKSVYFFWLINMTI